MVSMDESIVSLLVHVEIWPCVTLFRGWWFIGLIVVVSVCCCISLLYMQDLYGKSVSDFCDSWKRVCELKERMMFIMSKSCGVGLYAFFNLYVLIDLCLALTCGVLGRKN